MKKKDYAAIIISAVTFVLGIICYFVLPESVAVQWSWSGEVTNTLPKIIAILVSYGLTALLLFMSYSKENNKYTVFSSIGTILLIVFLAMN